MITREVGSNVGTLEVYLTKLKMLQELRWFQVEDFNQGGTTYCRLDAVNVASRFILKTMLFLKIFSDESKVLYK